MNRVVIITGAAGGIGHALCKSFIDMGDIVWALDRSEDGLAELSRAIVSNKLFVARLDITDRDAVHATVADVVAKHGKVDVTISNAGGVVEAFANDPMLDMTSTWAEDVALNLNGAAYVVDAVRPHMISAGVGAIVFIGSVNGLQFLGHPAYSAAKAGLVAHTKSLACLLGPHNIRVNLIAPGTVRTPAWESRLERDPEVLGKVSKWYPLGRVCVPADIANAAAFLVSDASSMITGITLPVDGGLMAGNPLMAAEIS